MSEHEQAFQQWLSTEQGQQARNLNQRGKCQAHLNALQRLHPAIDEALAGAFKAGYRAGSAS